MAEFCLEHQKHEGRPRTFILLWKCGCKYILLDVASESGQYLKVRCEESVCHREGPGRRYFIAGTEVVPIADGEPDAK